VAKKEERGEWWEASFLCFPTSVAVEQSRHHRVGFFKVIYSTVASLPVFGIQRRGIRSTLSHGLFLRTPVFFIREGNF